MPRKVGLPPDHPTLPSIMKYAAYRTALIGKWNLGALPEFGPLQSGYEYFDGFRSGAIDYFTHKSGPATTGAQDLWEGDVKMRQAGYLTSDTWPFTGRKTARGRLARPGDNPLAGPNSMRDRFGAGRNRHGLVPDLARRCRRGSRSGLPVRRD